MIFLWFESRNEPLFCIHRWYGEAILLEPVLCFLVFIVDSSTWILLLVYVCGALAPFQFSRVDACQIFFEHVSKVVVIFEIASLLAVRRNIWNDLCDRYDSGIFRNYISLEIEKIEWKIRQKDYNLSIIGVKISARLSIGLMIDLFLEYKFQIYLYLLSVNYRIMLGITKSHTFTRNECP